MHPARGSTFACAPQEGRSAPSATSDGGFGDPPRGAADYGRGSTRSPPSASGRHDGRGPPNAFPYFIAIERLVNADTTTRITLLVLAGYAVVYCLPCLWQAAIYLDASTLVASIAATA